MLHGIADGTRYSASERRRIAKVCARKQFSLFARLGIEETRGDRLLIVARTPPDIGTALSRASRLAAARHRAPMAVEARS